jgi:hypothetical protein
LLEHVVSCLNSGIKVVQSRHQNEPLDEFANGTAPLCASKHSQSRLEFMMKQRVIFYSTRTKGARDVPTWIVRPIQIRIYEHTTNI